MYTRAGPLHFGYRRRFLFFCHAFVLSFASSFENGHPPRGKIQKESTLERCTKVINICWLSSSVVARQVKDIVAVFFSSSSFLPNLMAVFSWRVISYMGVGFKGDTHTHGRSRVGWLLTRSHKGREGAFVGKDTNIERLCNICRLTHIR